MSFCQPVLLATGKDCWLLQAAFAAYQGWMYIAIKL